MFDLKTFSTVCLTYMLFIFWRYVIRASIWRLPNMASLELLVDVGFFFYLNAGGRYISDGWCILDLTFSRAWQNICPNDGNACLLTNSKLIKANGGDMNFDWN